MPSKPANQTPASPAQDDQAMRRYRLTSDHERRPGVVWPKGMHIDATPDEIKSGKIPAVPVDASSA